jgi:Carboxypeptidase regulatory-like domain
MMKRTSESLFSTISLFLFAFAGATLCAQVRSGAITGIISDSTGAVVPNARITLAGPGSLSRADVTDGQGRYHFLGLPPGEYSLQISAGGFAGYEATQLQINPGATLSHNARIELAATRQEVTVADTMQLDADPANNAGALTLKGSDLDSLSDDPNDLAEDLQALAGPAAGPNGGEIFVDGFSGSKLPPKSAIREVRVNQNPFSAEYDRLGFGRIEIFTKPGADSLRGEARFNFGDSIFNSRNPFAAEKPDYQRKMLEGNLGGPITKRSSFFLEGERRDIQETSVINALVMDPSFQVSPFRQAILSPTANTEAGLRIDYQLSSNHTLVGRYEWEDNNLDNQGLDTFSLPSRAIHRRTRDHVLRLTETAVLSPSAIHELRLQYTHGATTSQPESLDPAVQVPEAFTSGGAGSGPSAFHENRWEISNFVGLTRGPHTVKLGGRLRRVTQRDVSLANYNGVFTFTSLDGYRITQLGLRDGLTGLQIRALGGGANQFSIISGDSRADVGQVDAGVFLQDDWRIRPHLTLSAGLRYEIQNNIGDWRNFAPRVALAFAPGGGGGKPPVAVIRAGFGMFYDRVRESLVLEAHRLNGVLQQQYIVPNPDFYPNVPSAAVLAGNLQQRAIRALDGGMRAPYMAQSAVSIERQLPKKTTLSVTYTNLRGVHMLRSRNINAPLPGGFRPYSGGNIYSYESSGLFRQNQVIANLNARVSPRLSLFGYYVWNKANSDTDGAGTFPADQYDLRAEYGRAGFDVRHRAFIGGTMVVPYGLSLAPFIAANSGPPFNITTGRDLNGDSIFNDRPGWAADLVSSSVIRTQYGDFDTNPLPRQPIIPRNLGSGPGQLTVNLRLSKSFGFGEKPSATGQSDNQPSHGPPIAGGPGGGPGGHGDGHGSHGGTSAASGRYSVTFSVSARNLLNIVNPAPPVGNLSSPLFGTSVALGGFGHHGGASANRMLEFQMRFSF